MSDNEIAEVKEISSDEIKNRIYTIRGVQVMLDSDLAQIYGYETKRFNEQIKNNIERFPEDLMFTLTSEEMQSLRSKKSASNGRGGLRYRPHVFTEQGIYMLMTVLKGDLAVHQSLYLIRMFKEMRDYLLQNQLVFQRLQNLEVFKLEADKNFKEIFKRLEEPREKKAVLFFKGQMYDAFSCIAKIIGQAKSDIILIDGYVDTGTLDLLSKKKKSASVEIYTSTSGCKLTQKEITDFNNEYGKLQISYTTEFHDRFMILDRKTLYHIGASIKDAGKKAFEISLIDDEKQAQEILKRLL